ncbi:MAG: hypothetical protein K8R21_01870 [Leptospira sp.]|nr:hypothetical protein [Leptospira sp.]
MEGTVVSDSVNLPSRIEGLCKMYGASVIGEDKFTRIESRDKYEYRILDSK